MTALYRFVFFFSSRRRHTRCLSDWSSDVCSSDLCCADQTTIARGTDEIVHDAVRRWKQHGRPNLRPHHRSEERRVGKECRARWGKDQKKQEKKYDEDIDRRFR